MSSDDLEAVFAERAKSLARTDAVDVRRGGTTLLAFSHGEIGLAIELPIVVRAIAGKVLTALPKAPSHLDCVFYDGGRIISALNPSALLSQNCSIEGPELVLLIEAGGARLGIRATRVLGPRTMDLRALGPASPALEPAIAACIRGIGEDLTVVLDGAALVSTLRGRRRDQS